MKFLSLQHIAIEDPGTFKDFLLEDGHSLTTIQLDEGDAIPSNLDEFDAMLCMGGPMDTHMEQEYPWLIPEKKAIGEYVLNLEKPFLGFCLGCQLLGEVLGGQVVKSIPSEIGVLDIHSQEDIETDPLFNFLPQSFKALQWHSYEVQDLENIKSVTLIASSPETKYQIFKFQEHAYGIQFHIEIKDTTVSDWGCVPEYKSALESQLGKGALAKFDNDAKINMSSMNKYSTILYDNFKKLV